MASPKVKNNVFGYLYYRATKNKAKWLECCRESFICQVKHKSGQKKINFDRAFNIQKEGDPIWLISTEYALIWQS